MNDSKKALDKIIKKSRVHLYKPIQIAEILHRDRISRDINLEDLETYRNASKRWRDEVTTVLVGRISTSSAKFQDNLFEPNALPASHIARLGTINREKNGIVENYIYHALKSRLEMVSVAKEYLATRDRKAFRLKEFIDIFESKPGLKRSIDKAYEIIVYALFSGIVRTLQVKVTLALDETKASMLKDFEKFTKAVLNLDSKVRSITVPARLNRVGVTNAADTGLDMVTNFGPIIQVKHLSLTSELAEDIVEGSSLDQVLIVCLDAEQEIIENIIKQIGLFQKIQGIVLFSDLEHWYSMALSDKYQASLGDALLRDLDREFTNEFPSSSGLDEFLQNRGYQAAALIDEWEQLA